MKSIAKSCLVASLALSMGASATFRELSVDGAMKHLQALQQIAEENDGHRAAGSSGHTFSANYIAQQLIMAGYTVELVPFDFDKYDQLEPGVMEIVTGDGTQVLEDEKDFNVMTFSKSGDVTQGVVQAVDLALGDDNQSTSGCEVEDFEGFEAGKIALIQRGACSFLQKAENAAAAGAIAIVIFNQGNQPTRKDLFGGTLSADNKVDVPVFSLPYDKGVELSKAEGASVNLSAKTTIENLITYNVIAETPTGDPENVVMLGSHLDSVPAGPGLNDNGSGSAAILEVAIKMMEVIKKTGERPHNKLRFAWWSAEEVGLIGSARYVDSLDEEERAKIAMYLNFDMVASPNYMLGVFDADGDTHGQEGPDGSAAIEQLFQMYFTLNGTPSVDVALSGRSDYAPFAEVGIAVGGLFTGAEGTKSEDEAALYGGMSGEAYDACYHQECDDINNINVEALDINLNAIGFSAITYAYSTSVVNGGKNARSLSKMFKRNSVRFERTSNVHSHCGHDEHKEF